MPMPAQSGVRARRSAGVERPDRGHTAAGNASTSPNPARWFTSSVVRTASLLGNGAGSQAHLTQPSARGSNASAMTTAVAAPAP